jgi:signal transduction histidine kinase
MLFKMREIAALGAHWFGPEAAGGAAGLWLWSRMRRGTERFRCEERLREELQAYAALDVRITPEQDVRAVAGRVCRAMSQRSAFRRTAMLVCDVEGRLRLAGSAGMEEAAVQSLEDWAGSLVVEKGAPGQAACHGAELGLRVGNGSFAVILGKRPAEIGVGRAVVIPLWTTGGRMLGALAVCADGLMTVRRSALREALAPLESLALKVARAMQEAALSERLTRAEKLAGLGLMAGGMALALNTPLTAVLGFAELIEGTGEEPRVKEDAAIIVREALKMRRTVTSMLEFWRPSQQAERPVDVLELVREVAAGCANQLEGRGVRLVVQAGGEELLVRGNRHRLRQLLEHLLNNAAQAVEETHEANAGEQKEIRLSATRGAGMRDAGTGDAGAVHLMVSDTGPGFREPSGVFEPCGARTEAGLGLSLCYGIVHEHGGEIRAFNLEPHGAAVAVELPVLQVVAERSLAMGEMVSG